MSGQDVPRAPEAMHRPLERFLTECSGARAAHIRALRPLSGGAIQENWLLDVALDGGPSAGDHTLVLRSDAPSGVATSLSRSQEFAVLQAVWEAGVAVPEPLWLEGEGHVIGRPFYVMRRVAGTALGPRLVKDMSLGGDRNQLAERLGRELAKIHKIKPPRDDLDFLDGAVGDPAQGAVRRYRGYLDALGKPHPALEWALRWCELHAPVPAEPTLIHQDFRTGNYMVDATGLTGVLDWEFSAWGDPLSDLGWFCAKCWRFGRDDLEAGGIAAREPFYKGYENESGQAVDGSRVAFWEVMAHVRWAVIARQQGARTVAGGEESLDLALTGRVYPPTLEHELLRLTPPSAWGAE